MRRLISKPSLRFACAAATAVLCVAAPAMAEPPSFATDPVVLARAAIGNQPGSAAVGVLHRGQLRYGLHRNDAAGRPAEAPAADTDGRRSVFGIGSISKVFTGLLLAQAVEVRELRLDDTLGALLSDKVRFASAQTASITLRQLVTHSACMPYMPDDVAKRSPTEQGALYDRPRLWHALGELKLPSSPPCAASYSNFGFAVLGETMAERFGKPWHQLVRERIAEPLGMNDTVQPQSDKLPRLMPGFDGPASAPLREMQALAPAAGLRSTTVDMLIFSRAVLAGRSGPLGAAAERLVTPLGRYEGHHIGYGVMVSGPPSRRVYAHNGRNNGYRAEWALAAATGEAAILLTSNLQAPVEPLMQELISSHHSAR